MDDHPLYASGSDSATSPGDRMGLWRRLQRNWAGNCSCLSPPASQHTPSLPPTFPLALFPLDTAVPAVF